MANNNEGSEMTDHWLHHRLFSQPKRSRRILNAMIMRMVNELPDDKYVAPELVRELLNMDIQFPVRVVEKQIGDGAMLIKMEPIVAPEFTKLPNPFGFDDIKSKWQRFVEAWARFKT